jgi:O-antigen/teichoic acid export membrane protein
VSQIRRDILSSYLTTASRLASWVVVTGIVYRRLGIQSFAMLALVRTTIGLLNYTTLGLAPATVRMLALKQNEPAGTASVYSSSVALGMICAVAATLIAVLYASFFSVIHVVPASLSLAHLRPFVLAMGLGTVLRLAGEPFGAALHVHGRLALDNILVAGAELVWLLLCALLLGWTLDLNLVGIAWFLSGLVLLAARSLCAGKRMRYAAFRAGAVQIGAMRALLSFGVLVALAQAADFLYAPTDNILINRFINPQTVAVYAPAIQIDASLLLLVTGMAVALFPHGALAAAQGDHARLRRFYLWGTGVSLALLLPCALVLWRIAPRLFHLWLGNPMPGTSAILPLVLIHSVVGGSSSVGRSILLALGKVRPFTIAVLLGGAGNVILSFALVYFCHLGLRGIVLGTIIAVIARCAIWTPWYVLKSLSPPAVPAWYNGLK